MTQAAFELQRADRKVIDVALKYGYTSPTSFNRAFQSVHGIKPMAAKHIGCTLCAYPAIKLSVKVTGGNEMAYHLEKKSGFRMVGIKTPLTENMDENMRRIPLFWQRAWMKNQIAEIAERSNGKPDGLLGVSVYDGPGNFNYYIAAASDVPAPEGMEEYWIPEGVWVVFEKEGMFREEVQDVFERFLTEFLPFSGYAYAGLPDVEVYPTEAEGAKGHSEVWIAIKEEKGE